MRQDLKKLHDIADDLESVFWVFLFVSLKCFAIFPPGHHPPLDIFEGAEVNSGWSKRKDYLNSDDLRKTTFTSDTLQELLQDISAHWREYHQAVVGAQDPEETMKVHELVSRPTFWIDKIACALRNLEEKQAASRLSIAEIKPNQPVEAKVTQKASVLRSSKKSMVAVTKTRTTISQVLAQSSKKRKAQDAAPTNGDAVGASAPRRSKRLKGKIHAVCM